MRQPDSASFRDDGAMSVLDCGEQRYCSGALDSRCDCAQTANWMLATFQRHWKTDQPDCCERSSSIVLKMVVVTNSCFTKSIKIFWTSTGPDFCTASQSHRFVLLRAQQPAWTAAYHKCCSSLRAHYRTCPAAGSGTASSPNELAAHAVAATSQQSTDHDPKKAQHHWQPARVVAPGCRTVHRPASAATVWSIAATSAATRPGSEYLTSRPAAAAHKGHLTSPRCINRSRR